MWPAVALAGEPVRLGGAPPDDARDWMNFTVDGVDRRLVRRTVSWGGVAANERIEVTQDGNVFEVEWRVAFPTEDQREAFLGALTAAQGVPRCEQPAPEGVRVFVLEGVLALVAEETPGGLAVRAHAWRGDCSALISLVESPERPWTPAFSPFHHRVDASGPLPVFVGPTEVARKAAEYWDAGIACTGRQPTHWTTITILEDPAMRPAGGARPENGAVREIRLRTAVDGHALAHEVAHAWGGAPSHPALREGLTELLAHCMRGTWTHRQLDADFQGDPTGTDLDLSWSDYQHALEIVARAASILTADALYAEGPKTWEWFWSALIDSGATRAELDEVAEAWPGQWPLDADGDGLSSEDEGGLGTDPWRWDSDADGWKDGLEPVARAVPLPDRGAFACVGSVRKRGLHPHDVQADGGFLTWRLETDGASLEQLPDRLERGAVVYAAFEPEPGTSAQAWIRSRALAPCPTR